ncbi:MAG: nucleotide sugar dehydrogenase [Paraprevotella sp.]|nr:nucleotide sugar dehydrogenase [Prevotella sp.]MCI6373550.1 nucleotide sugar dehydrogenase [Paraprevotella sp.]MDY3099159.1 nucleotide sugar dehydrogenase [Bacteroidaceae bacterium]MCI6744247.1 nucleotide sugar dehydrogenase [Paraprevotella sp.]MCI7082597.1 nucleotide sugar dehydrogenase [Paraprevotella sp.]
MKTEDIRICVIGLGYVGLPLARLFSTKFPTIGFDMNQSRVDALMSGHDATLEVDDALLQEAISKYGFVCTTDLEQIRDCNFYVVAVPTPVDRNNHPDLTPLLGASHTVGQVISRGDVVVYESTVYPGVTEEECLPQVERVSGLKYNQDFYAGYSPERINPGDKEHTVEKIRKVTSGSTPEIAQLVDSVYNAVLINGTHLAPSIRVAEASKIIENSQRDVNIAFMNELAKIFNAMGIDTNDVLEAAASKWNFIRLKPGLVGGHCISVDPYYLIQKAQVYGVLPRLMTNARRLNDGMGDYVANQVIRCMNLRGVMVKDARYLLLGITFKENCPDIRNTKVVDIYHTLSQYSSDITVYDPWANPESVQRAYGIQIQNHLPQQQFDAVILCVAHSQFLQLDVRSLVRGNGVVYDVKGVLDRHVIDARL